METEKMDCYKRPKHAWLPKLRKAHNCENTTRTAIIFADLLYYVAVKTHSEFGWKRTMETEKNNMKIQSTDAGAIAISPEPFSVGEKMKWLIEWEKIRKWSEMSF